jgi:hypothetical protein
MEKVGIFYGQLDCVGQFCILIGNWIIFWLFVICMYLPRFGILCQEKTGSPGRMTASSTFGGQKWSFLGDRLLIEHVIDNKVEH